MANIQYSKWSTLNNPALGTFTNSLVNHNAGVIVEQSAASPTHVLPDASIIGKNFAIVNSSLSSTFIVIQITGESGIENFAIQPGDSAVFRWVGNGVWEEDSGETLFSSGNEFITLPDTPLTYAGSAGLFVQVNDTEDGVIFTPSKAVLIQTINFDDVPDAAPGTFNIGSPLGSSRVDRVAVEVVTPFNDNTAINITVDAAGGLTALMTASEVNIQQAGSYISQLSGTQASTGQVTLSFNADPDGDGGTQGSLTVAVEFS